MIRKKKSKRMKKNHGLAAIGTGIRISGELGYISALGQLEAGKPLKDVLLTISQACTTQNTTKAITKGVILQGFRNAFGPVRLFSTRKAVISILGR
jgi:hypothetical protein